MDIKRVRITFVAPVLGTASADPEIHEKYIASKAPDAKSKEEEVEAVGVDEVIEKAKTIFPKNEKKEPVIFEYQLKGFFKDNQKALNRLGTWTNPDGKTTKLKLAAYKEKIDALVIAKPQKETLFEPDGERKIVYHLPEGGEIGDCQRPLRADTAQGERVALANSERIPVGSWIDFYLECTDEETMPYLVHCLNYGVVRGIGQWRNSGKGRFVWEELDDDGNVIGGNKERWMGGRQA